MKGPVEPKYGTANRDLQQIEADKTSRLRALRLAKEAQDRDSRSHRRRRYVKSGRRRSGQADRSTN